MQKGVYRYEKDENRQNETEHSGNDEINDICITNNHYRIYFDSWIYIYTYIYRTWTDSIRFIFLFLDYILFGIFSILDGIITIKVSGRMVKNYNLKKNMAKNNNSAINWEDMAEEILKKEKLTNMFTCPKSISANIYWKNDFYIGSIQEIVPEFSKEIVLLSKSSKHYPEELAQTLRRLDMKRPELFADENLDLEGRQHIVRRINDKLMYMTPDQTIFMTNYPMTVFEIS